MEFMDSFKRLDNLCSQIYGNDADNGKYVAGVAMYMNEMRKCGAAGYFVSGWNTYYDRLKNYLALRNSISHDYGVDEAGLFACGRLSENDVRWLEDFCDAMLEGRDPIALYYTAMRAGRDGARKGNRPPQPQKPKLNHAGVKRFPRRSRVNCRTVPCGCITKALRAKEG